MTRAQRTAYRLRWLLLVAGLFGLAAGVWWLLAPIIGQPGDFEPMGLLGVMGFSTGSEWLYGCVVAGYLGVFFLTQWLFLRPRRGFAFGLTATGRPMRKSVFIAALVASLLSLGFLATLLEVPNWWTWIILREPVRSGNGPQPRVWPGVLALLVAWSLWAWVFWVYWRQGDRYTQVGRMVRGLVAGSVLELFVAAAVQAFTYKRDDCYCCRGSYTGLVFGGTVLLWAFGPGVVLLFQRQKVRQHRLVPICQQCGYNLTGVASATCPECGEPIPVPLRKDPP
jgi:hypothetical protein